MQRKRNEGFTLIELMIVVAIIGILAAIAIPNFLRFQLKSKSSEGKVNLAAIRTAEESYFAEYGTYIAAAQSNPVWVPASRSQKDIFNEVACPGCDFNTIGWSPEGNVFFNYAVTLAPTPTGYTADAQADIDNDGVFQSWGYVHPDSGGNASAGILGTTPCAATGTWSGVVGADQLNVVGPCNQGDGQSVF
jgi:type IV pilus assembly protein PilA